MSQQPEALPFAVFDEFGNGVDDRVQDHIRAQVERLQAALRSLRSDTGLVKLMRHDQLRRIDEAIGPQVTTGHCPNKAQPGGCQLHNLHCGYPKCDTKEHRS